MGKNSTTASDPFTETALSITVPQEPTVCCYRIVGMTPYISEITPQTVQQDTVVSITINGDHTNWTSDSVILRCDYGITVDSVSAVSDTELTTQITVSDSTVTGYRSIEITCDSLTVIKENALEVTEYIFHSCCKYTFQHEWKVTFLYSRN